MAATILRSSSFCDQFQVGLATKHQLKIYLYVDLELGQVAELVALARPLRVTFHRAFDRTPDQRTALETLIEAGVDLVLTSGGAPTALAGASTLAALQAQAGDRLTVLAGGGIRGDSIRALLDRAPLREVHARATDPAIIRDLLTRLHTESS